MNFQQLEYIVALDDYQHFRKAAEHCHVTQPTLSMMVKKLEDELEVSLFDRTKQPVRPTKVGKEVIAKARKAIMEIKGITEVVQQHQGQVIGKLRIGIIPTLAPYLLPLFVPTLLEKYPDIELQVKEMINDQIEDALQVGTMDMGILATPLANQDLLEVPLFYEKFYAFVATSNPLYDKQYIVPNDIDGNQLWLLEEGDCFRNQVMNLCELKKTHVSKMNLKYEAGSIETLKRFVQQNNGVTILPELAVSDMNERGQKLVRRFCNPEPTREIRLVTHKTNIKNQMVRVLEEEIKAALPKEISQQKA